MTVLLDLEIHLTTSRLLFSMFCTHRVDVDQKIDPLPTVVHFYYTLMKDHFLVVSSLGGKLASFVDGINLGAPI